jgi:hypothetical protein
VLSCQFGTKAKKIMNFPHPQQLAVGPTLASLTAAQPSIVLDTHERDKAWSSHHLSHFSLPGPARRCRFRHRIAKRRHFRASSSRMAAALLLRLLERVETWNGAASSLTKILQLLRSFSSATARSGETLSARLPISSALCPPTSGASARELRAVAPALRASARAPCRP